MKKNLTITALNLSVLIALQFCSQSLFASDHIDGPVSIANQVADLTDLFVFPTPGQQRSLTLILDMYPFVSSTGHFSDKVNYNFILRKAMAAADGSHFVTDPSSEVVITCKFTTPPSSVADIQMTCASHEVQPRVIGQIAFNQTTQPTVGNNITLFAGRRADPFFLSKDFSAAYLGFKNGTPDAKNVIKDLNCLSIVLNVGIDQLYPPLISGRAIVGPAKTAVASGLKNNKTTKRALAQAEDYFIAVAAESVTFDNPQAPARRIDRIGRPEITNISLNFKSGDPEIRDDYNDQRPFAVPSEKLASYVARLQKNIGRYDMMDAHQDWNASNLNRLATILADDFLIVDPFVACLRSSFFEIEQALLLGQPHQSCGGRDPNDNVVNKLYTLYELGPVPMASVTITDGLTGPSKAISSSFPYLADPYDGFAAWLAQKLANAAKEFF